MSKEKPKAAAQVKTAPSVHEKATFAFARENYKMMLIGIAVVAIGMLLMVGGASDDVNKMSDKIFDFQRLKHASMSFCELCT